MSEKEFSFEKYIVLTEFLGRTLGPYYEVALHDLSNYEHSLIAIANNHISGREIGAPLTNIAMKIVAEKKHDFNSYLINYKGESKEGKTLRSSTFFIKDDEGNLRGLLCINFDSSKYQFLSEAVMRLAHPDSFLESNFNFLKSDEEFSTDLMDKETFPSSSTEALEIYVAEAMEQIGIPADRMTPEEKQKAVFIMKEKGVFLLKGSVKTVAKTLNCSIATIYRYLS